MDNFESNAKMRFFHVPNVYRVIERGQRAKRLSGARRRKTEDKGGSASNEHARAHVEIGNALHSCRGRFSPLRSRPIRFDGGFNGYLFSAELRAEISGFHLDDIINFIPPALSTNEKRLERSSPR